MFDYDWTGSVTRSDIQAGLMPFVNWEVFSATLDDIIGGVYDIEAGEAWLKISNIQMFDRRRFTRIDILLKRRFDFIGFPLLAWIGNHRTPRLSA